MRMVFDAKDQYPSQWAAIESIAGKIGCTGETLRKWIRQGQRDSGPRPGPTTDEQQRTKELERKVCELRCFRCSRVIWWKTRDSSGSLKTGLSKETSSRNDSFQAYDEDLGGDLMRGTKLTPGRTACRVATRPCAPCFQTYRKNLLSDINADEQNGRRLPKRHVVNGREATRVALAR